MRKISASYIVTGNCPPLKHGILVSESDGTIIDVIDTGGKLPEQAGLEYYNGILVPGFINAHCHLELSHLKGKIQEKNGLGKFLEEINRLRNMESENEEEAIEKADFEMQHCGIVAIGDISNSTTTLEKKSKSRLYYHTFVEAFGFLPAHAEKAFRFAEVTENLFHQAGLPASVTPHSSYSVSERLFLKIKEKAYSENSILTIHNQESLAEEMFFKTYKEPVFHHLHHNPELDIIHMKPRQERILSLILPFFPKENQLLLVHNVFITREDIEIIKKYREMENTFFVICTNANLYIEDQLPPVTLFQQEKLNICLGTDSLASNHQLSILEEMITLQNHFPEIKIQELVEWGCLNGARALRLSSRLGSFEKGKNPGINLITGVDLQHLKFISTSRVKILQQPG